MNSKLKKYSFFFLLTSLTLITVFSVCSSYYQSSQILKSLQKVSEQSNGKQRKALSLQISHFDSADYNWLIKAATSNSDRKLDSVVAKEVLIIRKNPSGEEELIIKGPSAQIQANSKKVSFTEETKITVPKRGITAFASYLEVSDKEPIKVKDGFQIFPSLQEKDLWIKSQTALIELNFEHALLGEVSESPIAKDNQDKTKIKAKELEVWLQKKAEKKAEKEAQEETQQKNNRKRKLKKIELRERAALLKKDFSLEANKIRVFFRANSKKDQIKEVEALGAVKVKTQDRLCTSNYLKIIYKDGNPSRAVFTGRPVAQEKQSKVTGQKIVYLFSEKRFKIIGDVRTI